MPISMMTRPNAMTTSIARARMVPTCPSRNHQPVRLASCSLLKEMAMIGTMVASIHSIPDTVPAAGIRNISTLTGMKNSMASQNSRLLERPRNSM